VKRLLILVGVCVAAAAVAASAFDHSSSATTKSAKVRVVHHLWFELVGQYRNSPPGATPITHIHYGYLSWIQGVYAFKAPPLTDATAEYTFFADAHTSQFIRNGPLGFVTRIGTITIYRDPSHNSDWSNPKTFRDGTRVLAATYRHQPVSSTLSGAVSLFSHDQITFTQAFSTPHGKVRLGTVGETFDEHYTGQNNMPGPPSGYFIGYAISR
jgi:hypothetical protein